MYFFLLNEALTESVLLVRRELRGRRARPLPLTQRKGGDGRMKAGKQHLSTSEEAELIRDTLAAERERKSSENSNLITNLRRAVLLWSRIEWEKRQSCTCPYFMHMKRMSRGMGQHESLSVSGIDFTPTSGMLGTDAQCKARPSHHHSETIINLILSSIPGIALKVCQKSGHHFFLLLLLLFTRNGHVGICSESLIRNQTCFY